MFKPQQLMVVCMLMTTYVITSSLSQYVEFHLNQPDSHLDYSFRYFIDEPKSGGVSLDHWEGKRSFDGVVSGGYGYRDPNGVARTVYYQVEGDKGFEAVIKTVSPGGHFYFQQHHKDSHQRLKNPKTPIQIAQPISFLN